VDLSGLEPRRSDLARGIVIARAARPLDEAAQRALWEALARGGVTELSDPDERDAAEDAMPRQWLAAPWLPPLPEEADAQRAALEAAAVAHGLEAIWCVKIETGVDAVTWVELGGGGEGLARSRARSEADQPYDPDESYEPYGAPAPGEVEVVDAIFDEAVVLYAAPDAPAADGGGGGGEGEGEGEGEDEDEDDEDDEDEDDEDDD
jgi:hypothetical protein